MLDSPSTPEARARGEKGGDSVDSPFAFQRGASFASRRGIVECTFTTTDTRLPYSGLVLGADTVLGCRQCPSVAFVSSQTFSIRWYVTIAAEEGGEE